MIADENFTNGKQVMNNTIENALAEIAEQSPQQTDGKWLEHLTPRCAPLIADWHVSTAWHWDDWPDREKEGYGTDIGIDAVARRAADGKLIAIQCKSRKLNEQGRGNNITKDEMNDFLSTSARPIWAERWVVVIGDTRISPNSKAAAGPEKPLKTINIESDLRKQLEHDQSAETEPCQHCTEEGGTQTRDCMQSEAIEQSTTLLQEHAKVNENGKSRGRIILPCGTGKSRLALRIIEKLTEPGQISAVLCPSISLVGQIRSEFLAHRQGDLNALAVCSDEGVAKDKELATDPTADLGHASATELKGLVTTKVDEIVKWIKDVAEKGDCIGVIFGTYQSSHRIADALTSNKQQIQVLVADEAHRTAGLRRIPKLADKLRDFTICHDDSRFPAKYRIYQTATPRVYGGVKNKRSDDWIVRDMADEETFGPELYRRSYKEAVENGWLTDYRIIAIGVNDKDAYDTANFLAARANNNQLSTAHFLRGLVLALVMGGALRSKGVDIRSSINFMNLIARSKKMTDALRTETVREWVQRRLAAEGDELPARSYQLEHLDAKSKATERENAKARLMGATDDIPHGILNVGIFGEGVDAPALSAVGFLEARKSPVDVIQAVGRVMRRAKGKEKGYIICPILIPPGTDAETWLRNSGPSDGWQELGQILLALRAHDSRIEDELSDLMQLYLPPPPEDDIATMITLGGENRRVQHHGHVGLPGTAEEDVKKVLEGKAKPGEVFCPLVDVVPDVVDDAEDPQDENLPPDTPIGLTPEEDNDRGVVTEAGSDQKNSPAGDSPDKGKPPATFPGLIAERIVSGKRNTDGSTDIREANIERDRNKDKADGTPGPVDVKKSKKTGKKMVNDGYGQKIIVNRWRKNRRKATEIQKISTLFDEVEDVGITVNLLAQSGLARNRTERDVNILEDSIYEAKRCLKVDELDALLDRFFGLDQLDDEKRKKQADGCTIASLLLMNAAMLHQRIAAGGWLPRISGLDAVKNAPEAIDEFHSQWGRITRHDFLPVIEPAIDIIEEIRANGRREGLNRALRHLASEAERIAESYADLGADHAGPLFNRVMGNQASDGAYFTRPPSAALLACLTLDATGNDVDWTKDSTWKEYRSVDLACGSGTLIAALLTDMKRRAEEQGASKQRQAELQKLAVEEVIAGLDFNPVSLQLAAAQLTAGNSAVAYRKIGLHCMPYGPVEQGNIRVGSLELLGQSSIVPRSGQLDLGDANLGSMQMHMTNDDPLLEYAVDAVKNVRIVIMNPPFTNRTKMGEKFPTQIQKAMRKRVDTLEKRLVQNDPELAGFADKNSISPLFVALADRCIDSDKGILATILPTVALAATSGQNERVALGRRFHIHTLLTSHQPGQINLSQNTSINESMIIAKRHKGIRPATRIVNLDRMPTDESEVEELHRHLLDCQTGQIPDGWGEVSEWPAESIEVGDWSAAIFRSPKLAFSSSRVAKDERMPRLRDLGMIPAATGQLLRGKFKASTPGTQGSFPILKSKGADGQKFIKANPDEFWIPKEPLPLGSMLEENVHIETKKIQKKAGNLLITAGQDNSSARLTAVAGEEVFVGNGWMPISGLVPKQAMACAVAINSTVGRLQLMRNPGRKLEFPTYSAQETANLRVPDLTNEHICTILAECWDQTCDMVVPQFRDGECEVRRLWDEAVATAMCWDLDWLSELRHLLHDEPHVRGLGREQYGD